MYLRTWLPQVRTCCSWVGPTAVKSGGGDGAAAQCQMWDGVGRWRLCTRVHDPCACPHPGTYLRSPSKMKQLAGWWSALTPADAPPPGLLLA